MFPDTSQRTDEEEVMDDFSLEGESFGKVLDSIAMINKWLGGNRITTSALRNEIRKISKDKTIRIIDAGCGNGDMCRAVANMTKKSNLKVEIIGVDANQYTIKYANQLSQDFPEISYKCLDIFSDDFLQIPKDFLITTLTLHHFKDEQIVNWLSSNIKDGSVVIVNDLERSGLSYRLFQGLCFITRMDEMNRKDGLISILRGFKRKDLKDYSNKINEIIGGVMFDIQWKWAFRYLWTIKKI